MATKNETVAGPGFKIIAPEIKQIAVNIIGSRPLIVHAWSQKARQQMLDIQTNRGKAKLKAERPDRNPQEDYEGARYISDEGWDGFPAVGFKASMVGACRQFEGLSMTMAKRLFFVMPDGTSTKQSSDLVRIYGEPQMREDVIRVQSGSSDLRYRPYYTPWRAILNVRFNGSILSETDILSVLRLAGMSEGVGEWRPGAPSSATGSYGLWNLED